MDDQKPVVVIHYDAKGNESYLLTKRVTVLTADERCATDRVYRSHPNALHDEIAELVGGSIVGHRHRAFDIRLRALDLKIPRLQKGSYFPGFLEPRRTTEQALVAVIQKAWVQGVSTRTVDDLVQAMGMSGISKR